VFLQQEKCILFLEVSCPADVNVVEKEEEKVQKYHSLASELSHCYEQSVDTIPVVFGHLGVVSSHNQHHLKRIPFYSEHLFQNLQKAALIGTILIMRYLNFSCIT